MKNKTNTRYCYNKLIASGTLKCPAENFGIMLSVQKQTNRKRITIEFCIAKIFASFLLIEKDLINDDTDDIVCN